MNHNISQRKLNRTSSHRKAMLSNMATSLIQHEMIKTTLPKAKELRPMLEKLVTLMKDPTLTNRRLAISRLNNDPETVKKLEDIAERMQDRQGGYLRIIKAGYRYGDCAPMAYVEFVDREPQLDEEDDDE